MATLGKTKRASSAEVDAVKKALSNGVYKHKDDAIKDICPIFKDFKNLKPGLAVYNFDNGEKHDLLKLDGCIETIYQGKKYNTPVCIWFTINYPAVPPMVYVVPAHNMSLVRSEYVLAGGRVHLPILHKDNWKYPQSNLGLLLQILSIHFGDEPPVIKNRPPSQTVSPPVTTSSTSQASYFSYLSSWLGARPKEPTTTMSAQAMAQTMPVTIATTPTSPTSPLMTQLPATTPSPVTTSSPVTTPSSPQPATEDCNLPCSGCNTVMQMMVQQADEITLLKAELRSLKQEMESMKSGHNHGLTSDDGDGDCVDDGTGTYR